METDITLDVFKEQILELCLSNPDVVNPRLFGGIECTYHDPGKTGVRCHCLIGQWLKTYQNYDFEKDPLDTRSNQDAFELLKDTFGVEIAGFAAAVQMVADNGSNNNPPISWGEVASPIRWGDIDFDLVEEKYQDRQK